MWFFKKGVCGAINNMNKNNEKLVKRYLSLCRAKGLTERTIQGYEWDLGVFLKYIGDKNLINVSHIDIEDFLFYCQDDRKNGTDALIRKYNTLNSMYETLLRKDYIEGIKNPMYKVDKIKPAGNKVKEFLTKGEIHQTFDYLESINDLRGLAYFTLTYSSGARISETVQLNRNSLDMENRQFLTLGKGQKERICIFSEYAKECVLKYLEARTDDLEPLFISREKKRWSKSTIQQYVPRIVREAGINKHISPHSLRHSILTNMRLEGVSIEDLQLLAGHSSIQTTQKSYTHVGLLDIRKELDKFY